MKTLLRINLTTLLFLFVITSLKSQYVVQGAEDLRMNIRIYKGADVIEPLMYSKVKGDPFIFRNFRDAVITTSDGIFNLEVRYDMYAEEMHFRDKEKIFTVEQKEKIQTIKTDSLTFIYSALVKTQGKPDIDGAFFILLADGKCKLLMKKKYKLQDPELPRLYQDARPAEFIKLNDSFYVKKDDGAAVLIKVAGDLHPAMEDQKEAVTAYIKSNKTNFRKAGDLIKLIEFYNNL
jgi:hypothetical protein